MLKLIYETMEKAGIKAPAELFFTILIILVLIGIIVIYKKYVRPFIIKSLEVRENIDSINALRETQTKAIQKSIDCDIETNKRIDSIEVKLDGIIDSINQLQDSISGQVAINKTHSEALKIMLCNEINKRHLRYNELGYIPKDEYDEYIDMYHVYHDGLHGNHSGEAKFNYDMEHLQMR